MNSIEEIKKQLSYLEKRATKNIKEVNITRYNLSDDVINHFKSLDGYKIVTRKEPDGLFKKKTCCIITKYINR